MENLHPDNPSFSATVRQCLRRLRGHRVTRYAMGEADGDDVPDFVSFDELRAELGSWVADRLAPEFVHTDHDGRLVMDRRELTDRIALLFTR